MDDVYVYLVDLPPGIHEMVAPCCDGGYTIYIDKELDEGRRLEAYRHALKHIQGGDHYRGDSVDDIENKAHQKGGTL